MRGLTFWMAIIAVGSLVFFPASVAFSDKNIAKGPTPGGLYIVGPGHGTNYPVLYYSSDYGKTITPIDSTTHMGSITADASEGGVYCVAGGGGLYYSQNYGDSFAYQSGVGHIGGTISSGRVPGEIYNNGTRHSIDYGKTFTQHLGIGLTGDIRDVSVGHEAGEIYWINYQGELYFSTDYGDTFKLKYDFGSPQGRFWSLRRGAVSGEVYLLCKTTGQLYYSSDYGGTFKEKKQFPGEDYFWVIDMVGGVNQGDVFVDRYRIYSEGGGEIHIYYSADYGSTFVEYKHIFNAVEEEQEGEGLPRAIELGQNWPNPFNAKTIINYQLSIINSAPTTLQIYNILGEEVRTLISQEQRAGRYEVVWDGKDNQGKEVSSGVYLCQLRVQTQKGDVAQKTRKLLLLR